MECVFGSDLIWILKCVSKNKVVMFSTIKPARTDGSDGLAAGKVSIGFIHATPGDMKSFRSSEDKIALMVQDIYELWMCWNST